MRPFSAMTAAFAAAVLIASNPALASPGNQYWWMDQPGAFGGASSGSSGHNSNQGYQPQQQQQSYAPQQQDNNYIESNNNNNNAALVQTECPAGTKCVADFFCDANAVMVGYRVSLTSAQKKKRGPLIPCMNAQGNFDVCCSTSAAPAQQQQQPARQNNNFQGQNNFQQQQQAPVQNNIPTGSCPNIGRLPPVEQCNGMASNCWSVNQADTDCAGNALCCFDGCRNACYFGGNNAPSQQPAASAPVPRPQVPAPRPQVPAPRPQAPQNNNNFQQQAPAPQNNNNNNNFPAPQNNNNFQGSAPQNTNNNQGQQQQSYPEVDPPANPTPAPRRPLPPAPAPQNNNNNCPNVSPLNGGQCSGERDTCWNTGRRDDCQRGFLCCNDGCVKTCYNEATGEFLRHPQSQLGSNNNVQQNQGSANVIVPRQPAPAPAPRPAPVRRQQKPRPAAPSQHFRQPQPAHKPWPQQQQARPQPPRRQQTQQQSYPQPQQQQQYIPQQQQQQFSSGPVVPSSTKPFVTCPAAMKCVPRGQCDFTGVMTEQFINYTPELEMLSVPTIPCVSPANQAIDVCCRDPNYKDPWPNMNGNNNNGNNGNNGFRGNNGNGNNFQGQQQQPQQNHQSSNNSPRRKSSGYAGK